MTREITKLIAFLLAAVMPFFANAQNNPGLTDALNQQIIPLRTVEPDTNFSDLKKLKTILKDKQIIGMGEATHGTHEFFTFKHRMLEFLVKEMGVKTFVMEADFGGTQQVNDYVLYGKGNVYQAIGGTSLEVWMTKEVADMINWIKTYNDTQQPEDKITFWGCDVQSGYFAAQRLKDYLAANNELTPVVDAGLNASQKYWRTLTKADKAAIRTALTRLNTLNLAAADAAVYKRDLRQMQQHLDYAEANSKLFPARQDDARDKYMAENTEWIYNYTGHKKMMIWAHNQHICKSTGSEGINGMGMRLAQSLGGAYCAMGFDFYDGSMRSFDMKTSKYFDAEIPPAKSTSTGDVFSRCNTPNFILDLKSASVDPSIASFATSQTQSSFYGALYPTPYYTTHRLADAYDAVIFVRHTTPAQSTHVLLQQ